jgi:hypothetical protein
LETFAFERMSLAKMELTDPDAAFFMSSASAVPAVLATSEAPLSAERERERLDEERAEEKAYSTRLMIIVISGTTDASLAHDTVCCSALTTASVQRWPSWPRDCRTWARGSSSAWPR